MKTEDKGSFHFMARLAGGFEATVAALGVVEPYRPIIVQVLPDGEDLKIGVQWTDDQGPQPPIGTCVKIFPCGEIRLL